MQSFPHCVSFIAGEEKTRLPAQEASKEAAAANGGFGEGVISSVAFRLRQPAALSLCALLLLPAVLLLPAIWNGYPLLQYDTGGYLARWYEGYLVPSRSTSYGLYLHFGEGSHFLLNLVVQSAAAVWLMMVTLRVLGVAQVWLRVAAILAVALTTALPFLASMLLTDIFAGLSVLSLFLLVGHGDAFTPGERAFLLLVTAFSASTHSATFGVLIGLVAIGWLALRFIPDRLSARGLWRGTFAIVLGAVMLLAANFMFSGRVVWTPGGSAVAFGRMLQDGFVKRYLDDHCGSRAYKLCPHRATLPETADSFLWGKSVFNQLGRFNGLGEEMAEIAGRSLLAYPLDQAKAALRASGEQLVAVATGEGTHNSLWHTYGIMERFLPQEVPSVRAARQQKGDLDFLAINRIHVPVALISMLLLAVLVSRSFVQREFDNLSLFASTAVLALLGNAFLCGVLSGPHDRYGARMVWIATFAVLAAALQWRPSRAASTAATPVELGEAVPVRAS